MHNRNIFFTAAALGSACLVSSFTGCSSSSSSNNPTPDSGTESDSGTVADTGSPLQDSSTTSEASNPQDSGTSSADGGLNCLTGTAPTGTPILSSVTASVQGVIGSDTVLFFDSSASTLNSVPIAGGSPTMISAYDNSGLLISGNVVLWSHNPTAATATAPAFGPLLSSVSGAAAKTVTTAAYQSGIGNGYIDVSSDGSLILYMTTTAAAPTTANIVVSAPDGTGAVTLVPNVVYSASANGTLCTPNARFVGNTVVAAYCTTAPTTQMESTIAQFHVTGGAPIQTFTTAGFFGFSIDNPKTPTQISYLTAGGQYVQSLTVGSTPKLIDKDGAGGAFFSADGLSLIYDQFILNDAGTGGTGGIYRSNIASPSPQKIVAGTFGGTLSISPDTNWLVTYEQTNSTGTLTDMYLVSTAPGSSLQTLCPTTTATFFGDNFTVDDTQVLFFCNVNGPVGDFDAEKLMTGATKTTVGAATVWQENAVSGAKVLYNNNYVSGGKVFGYADIQAQDLSTTAAPTTVVSHADANYYLTADKTKLIYSFSACTNLGAAGIYVIPAP
jgi:hypothetical protein